MKSSCTCLPSAVGAVAIDSPYPLPLATASSGILRDAPISIGIDGYNSSVSHRHDWLNQHFFLSDNPCSLLPVQTTATPGHMCWWGTKQGN